jgi:serine/threonine protein phosphatase PrpC
VLRTARSVVVDLAELSDAGRDPAKQVNEDSSGYAETPAGHLAIVCDGMGGHAGGREASQAAVKTILELFSKDAPDLTPAAMLTRSIEQAARAVYAIGGSSPPELRPGSTCVTVLLHDGWADVAHVGDSRVYLVRRGTIRRVTRDHSMVQDLIDSGQLAPEDALSHPDANKITRALGIGLEVDVDLSEPIPLEAGDTFLLASDGLTDLVMDPEIAQITTERGPSGPAVVCQELVNLANSRGGHDNITVLVLNVVDPGMRRAAGGTVVQAGHTVVDAGPTIVESGPTTLVGGVGKSSGAAPTLFDDPHYERQTQPGDDPHAPRPRFNQDHPVAPPVTGWRASPGRTLLFIGIACVIVILMSVAVFAWKKSRERAQAVEDEVLPPPAPVVKPAPSRAIEPLIVPVEKPDSGTAPKEDAGPKDASEADE